MCVRRSAQMHVCVFLTAPGSGPGRQSCSFASGSEGDLHAACWGRSTVQVSSPVEHVQSVKAYGEKKACCVLDVGFLLCFAAWTPTAHSGRWRSRRLRASPTSRSRSHCSRSLNLLSTARPKSQCVVQSSLAAAGAPQLSGSFFFFNHHHFSLLKRLTNVSGLSQSSISNSPAEQWWRAASVTFHLSYSEVPPTVLLRGGP